MNVEHSRSSLLGSRATGQTANQLLRRLETADVTISADAKHPGAVASLGLLAETLRRQPFRLHIDPAGLAPGTVEHIVEACRRIDPSRRVEVGRSAGSAVHIGLDERAPIRVVPDAYGARLARSGALRQTRAGNGVGIVFAAAVAAGEVFKDAAGVLPERQVRHEQLAFCPVTLSDDLEQAAELEERTLNLALVGLGAVGSATARILSLMHFHGRILLVDPETYAHENLGTYSLGDRSDAARRRPKVDLAAAALSRAFQTVCYQGSVESATREIDLGRLPWPRLVLSGLDSVEARHATQLLWPDRLIDAATGDTSLGIHEAADGSACMMCFFPASEAGPSSLTRLIEATGLPREVLAHGDQLLTAGHVAGVPDLQKRESLRPHIGTAVCGLAQAMGLLSDGDHAYMPSVPFVSQQSACLGVGRLIAHLLGFEGLPNLVQYDALLGPVSRAEMTQPPRDSCYSVLNRETIELVRAHRSSLTPYPSRAAVCE